MTPEVVQSTAFSPSYPASSLLILGDEDGWLENDKWNFWLAEQGKTIGQGFTLKVDSCKRWIAGCKIKNKGKGQKPDWSSKGFRVSGSKNENGPWEILVEDELDDNRGKIPASLLDFTFKKPVEIQFLKFDLVSYWDQGGGLQYFAAIPVTSKKQKVINNKNMCTRWVCS